MSTVSTTHKQGHRHWNMVLLLLAFLPLLQSPFWGNSVNIEATYHASSVNLLACPDSEPITRWNKLAPAERAALNDNDPATNVAGFHTGFCAGGNPLLADISVTGAPNSLVPGTINNRFPNRWGLSSFNNGRESAGNSGSKYCFTFNQPVPLTVSSQEHQYFYDGEVVRVTAFDGVNAVVLAGSLNGPVGPATMTGNGTTEIVFAANMKRGTGVWWEATTAGNPATQVCVEYYRQSLGQGYYGREPFSVSVCNADRCYFDDPLAVAHPANPNPADPAGLVDRLGFTNEITCAGQAASGTPGNLDVEMRMVLTNNGNADLSNLQIENDLEDHIFGTALVGLIGLDFGPGNNPTASPVFNPNFDGEDAIQIFDGASGTLAPGESVVVDLVLEINPNKLTPYEQVSVHPFAYGRDPSGSMVSAAADAPAGTPGDLGTPVDGAFVWLPAVNVSQEILNYTTSVACGNAGGSEFTLRLFVENTGNVDLDSFSLTQDFAAQMGTAFAGLVSPPAIVASTAAANPVFDPAYNGTTAHQNLFNGQSGLLEPGQALTIEVRVRADANAALAPASPTLQANVLARGVWPTGLPLHGCPAGEILASDASDSGNVPESENAAAPGDTGGHNDPLPVRLPGISVSKQLLSFTPALSQTPGNLDARFRLVVKNTGNMDLENLTLADDLAAQLGSVYGALINPPYIVSSTATVAPGVGVSLAQMFNGTTGLLRPNQSITLEFAVELNPDAAGAIFPLKAQATAGGKLVGHAQTVSDLSDGGADPEGTNAGFPGDTGCSDDQLALNLPAIRAAKHIAGVSAAASNVPGNFEVTAEILVQNVGSVDLTGLGIVENLGSAANLGSAFVGVVQAPQIVAVGAHGTAANATTAPSVNAGYNGTGNLLSGGGLLKQGEVFIVRFRYEVNPDAPGAPAVLKNQAEAYGTGAGPSGVAMQVTDNTDAGIDPQGNNANWPGSGSGTNDPTLLTNCWSLLGNGIACNDLMQVSLNQVCVAQLTPEMVLEGEFDHCGGSDLFPLGSYYQVAMVTTQSGFQLTDLDPATPNVFEISGSYVDQTLVVKVMDKVFENACWGEIILKDKLAPVFNCPAAPVQVFCNESPNSVPAPTATDNCDANLSVNLIGSQIIDNDICNDGIYRIRRTYAVQDSHGNVAANNCVQELHLVRPAVDFPDDITWSCTQHDGFPSILNPTPLNAAVTDTNPAGLGINVSQSLPDSILNITGSGTVNVGGSGLCSYQVIPLDQVVATCGNSFKIVRTWTVIDWCTGDFISTGVGGEDNVQTINVADLKAPVITMQPFEVGVNLEAAAPYGCRSTGFIPAPAVTDDCNSYTVQILTSIGEATYVGTDGKQGGYIPVPGLPIGTFPVTYVVTDACGNQSMLVVQMSVVDDTTPSAVCDELTDVNLNSNGTAEVPALVFDDGSTDNCCVHHFEVRRMDDPCNDGHDDTVFGPSIIFCCTDVANSPIMVVFRVFDCYGNFNDCMVEVEVNDKIDPSVVSCPSNQRMTCNVFTNQYETQLAALAGSPNAQNQLLNAQFGTPNFTDNCSFTMSGSLGINLDQCQEGTLVRTWTATDPDGQVSPVCTQTIFVDHVSDWVVAFPEDITVNCGQTLPDFGEPEIFYETCELVAVSYEDSPFVTVADACYKIIRTWKVINWCVVGDVVNEEVVEVPENQLGLAFPQCDLDGDGDCDSRTFRDSWTATQKPNAAQATLLTGPDTDTDTDPWDGFITYNQTVKVLDLVDPVFANGCAVPPVCIEGANCTGTVLLPTPTATDCSPQLTFSATGSLGNGFGPFANVSPGTYNVTYTAMDQCGNDAVCSTTVTVQDCKKPTPYCKNGLVVEIMNSFPPQVVVNASQLNDNSFDNCAGALQYSFSANVANKTMTLTCANIGQTPVQVWVTDAAGNQDFCTTFIELQANLNQCNDDTLVVNVGGFIETPDNDAIGGVTVSLSGQSNATAMTSAGGGYNFNGVPVGNDVTVTPIKDTNPLEGVTTFDMVLISKHILNIEALDSPYKLIAADVNNSKTITTFDLVEIRKLVLLVNTAFPNNTSWRFVDRNYVFPQPHNPWYEAFPEIISYNNLPSEQLDADFVAVKIGDVNNSAGFAANGGDERSAATWVLETTDQLLKAGETYTLDFTTRDPAVAGFQFTLDFDVEALDFQGIAPALTVEGNFGKAKLDAGAITASWNEHGDRAEAGLPVMRLRFLAKMDIRLSEAVQVSGRYTAAEAYTPNGEAMNVALQFRDGLSFEAFELYQNRPNPFRDQTVVAFRLPDAGPAKLTITDTGGRVLKTIEGQYQAGYNEVQVPRNGLPASGILYYRLDAAADSATKMMLLVE